MLMAEHALATALLAGTAALAMGFAIQRGGTCTVAAVDEWLSQRRLRRAAALLEASLWVAGGLALARWLGWDQDLSPDHAAGAGTVIGGALLGLGAWLNGACAFGTLARLGCGQWAYAATPPAYLVGCLVATMLLPRAPGPLQAPEAIVLRAAGVAGPLFLAYALLRVGPALLRLRGPGGPAALKRTVWAPHAATIVIGVTFVVTLLSAGRWAYTDVLADLADRMRGGTLDLGLPALLLVLLLGGALLGGYSAGLWRPTPPSLRRVASCLAGGALMGCGSLLIPGSNDGLILIGLPLLLPHAALALAAMVIAITAALSAQRWWSTRASTT